MLYKGKYIDFCNPPALKSTNALVYNLCSDSETHAVISPVKRVVNIRQQKLEDESSSRVEDRIEIGQEEHAEDGIRDFITTVVDVRVVVRAAQTKVIILILGDKII
jgi:hypothetical protein